jgi:2-iminoacetate synthase ThiH
MSFTDKFNKEDYYLTEEGYIVFTEAYHLKRGYCCNNNCRHCPYKKKNNNPSGSGNTKKSLNL